MQKLSCENELDLHENEHLGGTHFHMNCFVRRLVLTQRRKVTWKMARLSFVGHITKGEKE